MSASQRRSSIADRISACATSLVQQLSRSAPCHSREAAENPSAPSSCAPACTPRRSRSAAAPHRCPAADQRHSHRRCARTPPPPLSQLSQMAAAMKVLRARLHRLAVFLTLSAWIFGLIAGARPWDLHLEAGAAHRPPLQAALTASGRCLPALLCAQ